VGAVFLDEDFMLLIHQQFHEQTWLPVRYVSKSAVIREEAHGGFEPLRFLTATHGVTARVESLPDLS
jgi:hypothetical protein